MSDNGRPVNLPLVPPEYRAPGVLLHVSSPPSPYGIGDVVFQPRKIERSIIGHDLPALLAGHRPYYLSPEMIQ